MRIFLFLLTLFLMPHVFAGVIPHKSPCVKACPKPGDPARPACVLKCVSPTKKK